MVGTIGTGGGTVALVMGPDKVTYRVRPGGYWGRATGGSLRSSKTVWS